MEKQTGTQVYRSEDCHFPAAGSILVLRALFLVFGSEHALEFIAGRFTHETKGTITCGGNIERKRQLGGWFGCARVLACV